MKRWVSTAALATVLLGAAGVLAGVLIFRPFGSWLPGFGTTVLTEFRFDAPAALEGWSEKIFRGKTVYAIAPGPGGEPALRIDSRGTSSALYRELRVPITLNPVMEW